MTITTELLLAVQSGETTFNQFATECAGDFTALAIHVARSWGSLPPAMEVDDLSQVMLMSVHQELPGAKAATIRDHIVFRACAAASRAIKRECFRTDSDDLQVIEDSQMPYQEHVLLARQRCEVLPDNQRQRVILQSLLRTWSFSDTTDELLAHPDTREMFPNPHTAKRAVMRTVRRLRDRVAVA